VSDKPTGLLPQVHTTRRSLKSAPRDFVQNPQEDEEDEEEEDERKKERKKTREE